MPRAKGELKGLQCYKEAKENITPILFRLISREKYIRKTSLFGMFSEEYISRLVEFTFALFDLLRDISCISEWSSLNYAINQESKGYSGDYE